jgi:hypothetical protein
LVSKVPKYSVASSARVSADAAGALNVAGSTRLPASTFSSIEIGPVWQGPSETLRKYYVELGVEFLGHPDATNPNLFYGVGVRWAALEKDIDN